MAASSVNNGPLDRLTVICSARLIAGMPADGYRPTTEPGATLVAMLEAADPADRMDTFEKALAGLGIPVDATLQQIKAADPNAAPPSADPWVIYTLKDAYKPRPPKQRIVKGVFAAPSLIVAYSYPGGLKTLLLQDAMACVAGGLGWLPPADPAKGDTTKETTQVPCLWLDFDNGMALTHERFEAIARSRKLPDDIPLHYVSMPTPWLSLADAVAVEDLKQRILRLGAKFVVLDNLGTVSGGVDENSAQMIQIMGALRQLAEATGAAIVVIHHQRKSNGGNTRAGDSLRGHSSIEAALDLALLVEREEHGENVIVKSTKTRGVDVYPFGAQFDFTHKPGSDDELETARFWGVMVDNPNSPKAIKDIIVDVVAKHGPISQTVVVSEVRKINPKVGVNRVRSYVADLATLGLLIARPGPVKHSIFYEVA